MIFRFLSPVSFFQQTLSFSTITYLNNNPETAFIFMWSYLLTEKILSFSKNTKKSKYKIPKWLFFQPFRNIFRTICLKVTPELLASTVECLCETYINEDLGNRSLLCLIFSPQFRTNKKLLFDRLNECPDLMPNCFPKIISNVSKSKQIITFSSKPEK